MTSPAPSPASMPGAPRPKCPYTEQEGLYRCVRQRDHGGNHTPRRVEGAAFLPPQTPPSTPHLTPIDVTAFERGRQRAPRSEPSPHATADLLDVAARLLRWTTHRGLTAEERSLLRTVHTSIVARVAAGPGVTSPTPGPP